MNEPFFSDRIEIQLATICTMISSFGGGKGQKPKHSDFMIRKSNHNKEKEKTDSEKTEEVLLNFFFKGGVK